MSKLQSPSAESRISSTLSWGYSNDGLKIQLDGARAVIPWKAALELAQYIQEKANAPKDTRSDRPVGTDNK